MRLCDVPGCQNVHKGRGLCNLHLLRLKRTGTTESPIKSLAERFAAKVNRDGPAHPYDPDQGRCHLWTAAVNEHGYGVMRPEGQRTGPTVKAHRVALTLAGRDPGKLMVLHSCDNPLCVNEAHLRAGTQRDNVDEMVSRGRQSRGMRSGTRKLTDSDVREIRRRVAAGELHRVVADDFGVGRTAVTNVWNRSTWAHVDAVTPPAARDLVSAVVGALS